MQPAEFSFQVRDLRLGYDKIEIVSSAYVGWLWKNLSVTELRAAVHEFNIKPMDDHPYYHSRVILVPLPGCHRAIELLVQNEGKLFSYSVVAAEVAADLLACTEEEALRNQIDSIPLVSKRRSVRGEVRVEYSGKKPRRGCLVGPTLYYEHASSSVGFKCYCRYDKDAYGKFTMIPITRWEWSLKRSAVTRYLGRNQLNYLLNADLRAFAEGQLEVGRVDQVALGRIISPASTARAEARVVRPPSTVKVRRGALSDPDYWARRAAYIFLVQQWSRKQRECTECDGDFICAKHEVEETVWLESPSHIRWLLNRMRRRWECPGSSKRRPALTRYLINQCFTARQGSHNRRHQLKNARLFKWQVKDISLKPGWGS